MNDETLKLGLFDKSKYGYILKAEELNKREILDFYAKVFNKLGIPFTIKDRNYLYDKINKEVRFTKDMKAKI